MGMFTALDLHVELVKEVPDDVVRVLKFLTSRGDDRPPTDPKTLPNHPFFKCERWRWVASMDSYYFAADTRSSFRYDDIGNAWMLGIRSNLKNYSNEIDLFIDWLTPWIYAMDGDFLGFKQYEEDRLPTLLLHPNQWRTVSLEPIHVPSAPDVARVAESPTPSLPPMSDSLRAALGHPPKQSSESRQAHTPDRGLYHE